jgi:hypothetical protein
MAGDPETEELIRRIEASRDQLGARVERLVANLDVPAMVRQRIARHPGWVFGGSAALGVAASSLLRRSRRKAKGGLRSTVFKWLLPTLFTALKPWLKSRLVREIEQRFQPTRPAGEPARPGGSEVPATRPPSSRL